MARLSGLICRTIAKARNRAYNAALLLCCVGILFPTIAKCNPVARPAFERRVWELKGLPAANELEIRAGDLNNDGRTDLFGVAPASSEVRVAFSTGSGFEELKSIPGLASGCRWQLSRTLDVDGDGKAELVTNSDESGALCVAYFSANSLTNSIFRFLPVERSPRPALLEMILGQLGKNLQLISTSADNAATFQRWTFQPEKQTIELSESTLPAGLAPLGTGDIDGDSKPEMLWLGVGAVFACWGPFSESSCRLQFYFPLRRSADRVYIGDFDGDGRDDVFQDSGGLEGTWLGLSGKHFGLEYDIDSLGIADAAARSRLLVTDLDGDGAEELALRRESQLDVWQLRPGVKKASQGAALSLDGLREGPSICTGYLPTGGNPLTELSSKWQMINNGNCPEGYAVWGNAVERDTPTLLARFASTSTPGAPISVSCCKLPESGMLTNEHVEAGDVCPEDSVVTGVHRPKCQTCGFTLRCTKINSQRYKLGKETPGVHWGVFVDMLHQNPRIPRSSIPPAIRDGIGREGVSTWTMRGCIGSPWGSLLTAKAYNRCSAMRYRQLQFTGLPGDPPPNTPVRMFPDCKEIEDSFDPLTGCKNL